MNQIISGSGVVIAVAGIIVVAIVAIGFMFSRLYNRASKQVSFVRTGLGGQKVIMNGGALVLPIVHEAISVNMNTLRLEVRRANEQALITRDRMRVDVTAEFYVRVKPSEESIANAAQTLGIKTMHTNELKALIEGKFVDALRSVAAEMDMEELHEKRSDFVQKVQQSVLEDLLKNGLELESVSLTGLDQTSFEYFNPQNAFDAEGLTKLTKAIESRRKARNDIEQDTAVAIQQKDLEAECKKLEIKREEEYAAMQQEREISVRKATQKAEIATQNAESERESEQAEILAKQKVDLSNLEAKRLVDQERIEMERLIKERDIAKNRSIETAEIERKQAIELSEQDRAIAVAERSKAQSEAKAQADIALADAVKAEEQVLTVRSTAQAEREKAVQLVQAHEEAETAAIGIKVAAEAEKIAAQDYAESVTITATAMADKLRIEAEGESDAEMMMVQVAEAKYTVDASGQELLNAADNTLSLEQITMKTKLALIKQMPEIIKQSVKPMENIDGIQIYQIDGINGASSAGKSVKCSSGENLADQVVNSALRYRGQAPLMDKLLSEIGLNTGGDINQMTSFAGSKSVDPTSKKTSK